MRCLLERCPPYEVSPLRCLLERCPHYEVSVRRGVRHRVSEVSVREVSAI